MLGINLRLHWALGVGENERDEFSAAPDPSCSNSVNELPCVVGSDACNIEDPRSGRPV